MTEMTYLNDYNQIIAEDRQTAREWLEAHPEYKGGIWMDEGDGSEAVDVGRDFREEMEDV